jgi:acetyl esterase/lipase
MPVAEMLAWIALHGEPADPRTDIDTESLRRRLPHLAAVQTTDVAIRAGQGSLPGRAYIDPTSIPTGRGLVWAHGGAFIGGHLDMPEANWVALELASRGTPVLSVDYTKCVGGVHYPTPSDDVLRWWCTAVENSDQWLGVDPDMLMLGGASAGATLTAGAVRRLIDASAPVPAGLILVYPALHADSTDPSAPRPAEPHLEGLSLNYAGSEAALSDPQVFAGLGDGVGYPPSLIVACELDAFVPSAESFHRTLRTAGVDAALRIELDSDHGHIDEPSDAGARRTIEAIHQWVSGR